MMFQTAGLFSSPTEAARQPTMSHIVVRPPSPSAIKVIPHIFLKASAAGFPPDAVLSYCMFQGNQGLGFEEGTT